MGPSFGLSLYSCLMFKLLYELTVYGSFDFVDVVVLMFGVFCVSGVVSVSTEHVCHRIFFSAAMFYVEYLNATIHLEMRELINRQLRMNVSAW